AQAERHGAPPGAIVPIHVGAGASVRIRYLEASAVLSVGRGNVSDNKDFHRAHGGGGWCAPIPISVKRHLALSGSQRVQYVERKNPDTRESQYRNNDIHEPHPDQ